MLPIRVLPALALLAGLLAAAPADAQDDFAARDRAARAVASVLPERVATREADGAVSEVAAGWRRVPYEVQGRRGWFPLDVLVHPGNGHALVGTLGEGGAGDGPRARAQSLLESQLPDGWRLRTVADRAIDAAGLHEVLVEAQRGGQGGARLLSVYVGEGFALRGGLRDPEGTDITGAGRRRFRGDLVSWDALTEGRQPAYGAAEAPVRVAMFTDPDCPSCRRAKERIEKLAERYPQRLAVYFLWYPLDAHPHAEPKARVLACAPAGRQAELFEALKPAEPEDVAGALEALRDSGMSVDQGLARCARQGKGSLARDRQLAQQGRVTGTPSVYFQGELYRGFPEPAIRRALEEGE